VDHANHFLGLRLNDWVSAALFVGALIYLYATRRPATEETPPPTADTEAAHEDSAAR
jgi:hypothetical protein